MAKNKNRNQFTCARAVRDIVVTAINKGQMPVLLGMTSIIVILCRIPEKDLSAILTLVISHLIAGELFAYVFLFAVCSTWFIQGKIARTNHSEEMNRVVKEKSQLQDMLVKKNFKSSKQ